MEEDWLRILRLRYMSLIYSYSYASHQPAENTEQGIRPIPPKSALFALFPLSLNASIIVVRGYRQNVYPISGHVKVNAFLVSKQWKKIQSYLKIMVWKINFKNNISHLYKPLYIFISINPYWESDGTR